MHHNFHALELCWAERYWSWYDRAAVLLLITCADTNFLVTEGC